MWSGHLILLTLSMLHSRCIKLHLHKNTCHPINAMRSIVFMIAALHFVIFVMWFAVVQFFQLLFLCPLAHIAPKRPVYLIFFHSISAFELIWFNDGSRHSMSLDGFYGQLFCQRVIRNGMGKFIVVLWQCWLLTEFSPASAKMNYCKHAYSTLCSVFVRCCCFVLFFRCSIFSSFLLSCLLSIQQQTPFTTIIKQNTKRNVEHFRTILFQWDHNTIWIALKCCVCERLGVRMWFC